MRESRKYKLYYLVLIACVLSIAAALFLYALRQNISLFYSPTQVYLGQAPLQKSIRLGGMVEKGSIVRKEGLLVTFKVTDFSNTIDVQYQGILPDLFKEGQGIVTQGILINKTQFKANEVLAKHDANYMPNEVKAALVRNKEKA